MAKGCYEATVVANLDEPLAFPAASFDALVCTGVLEYVERFDVLFPVSWQVCGTEAWAAYRMRQV